MTVADGSTYNLYVPSSSGHVGFINNANDSSVITAGFGSYGPTVYLNKNSVITTKWSAIPTNVTDVYTLEWESEDDEAIEVTLRTVAPSNM